MELIYEMVLDYEVPFVIYYEDSVPEDFDVDFGVRQKSRRPLSKALKDMTGSVLFLWDEDDIDLLEEVWEMIDEETDILELTNGLAPIVLEEDDTPDPEPVEEEEEEEDEDDTRFTKEELENMAAAAVKRYGARIGATGTTKTAIIKELFPEQEEEDEAGLPDEVDEYRESEQYKEDLDSISRKIDADAVDQALAPLRKLLIDMLDMQYD